MFGWSFFAKLIEFFVKLFLQFPPTYFRLFLLMTTPVVGARLPRIWPPSAEGAADGLRLPLAPPPICS